MLVLSILLTRFGVQIAVHVPLCFWSQYLEAKLWPLTKFSRSLTSQFSTRFYNLRFHLENKTV